MKSISEIVSTLVGYILGFLIGGAIFYWYNTIAYGRQYSYWQWVIVATGWILVTKMVPWIVYPFCLLTMTLVLCQFLGWADMIQLPLIKPE